MAIPHKRVISGAQTKQRKRHAKLLTKFMTVAHDGIGLDPPYSLGMMLGTGFYGDGTKCIPTLLEMFPQSDRRDWLEALGAWWTRCDNIGEFAPELLAAIRIAAPSLPALRMMDEPDVKAFNRLPAEFEVYRGCYDINSEGICWSTVRAAAVSFPRWRKYVRAGEQPILLRGIVKRSSVIAIKTGRGETELIIDPADVRIVSRENLGQPIPADVARPVIEMVPFMVAWREIAAPAGVDPEAFYDLVADAQLDRESRIVDTFVDINEVRSWWDKSAAVTFKFSTRHAQTRT